MTASYTVPIPPMFTISSGSGNPTRNIVGNARVGGAKRNLFGAPVSGEIKEICAAENIRRFNEFKEKYQCIKENKIFSNKYNKNNNEDEKEITTTTLTTIPTNNQINELKNNGQDEKSNINLLTKTAITEIDSSIDDDKSIINIHSNSKQNSIIDNANLLKFNNNLHDSECDTIKNDEKLSKIIDIDNNELGICNKKSLTDNKLNNNSNNKCDVMCNQINSTTTTNISSTITTSKSIVLEQQKQRISPYCIKKPSQQKSISGMFNIRKASSVKMIQPQKAKLLQHFDDIDQQQEKHLTSNEA